MYNRLVEFVEINEIPYLRPFGFRKNHSTLHALVDESVVFCHWLVHYIMDYKMTGLETSDHVGCFRFADWLLLSFKMAATEWKFVT